MSFTSFDLHPHLLRALDDLSFAVPTPIQKEAIAPALAGRDVLAAAATGSGKTAAFLLPILHRLIGRPRGTTRALILAPTRELAAQIDEHRRQLARHTSVGGARHLRGGGNAASGAGVAPRCRHPGRHTGAFARPHARSLRATGRARGPRPRRGGPDARHGLPARCQPDPEAASPAATNACSSPPLCRRPSWTSPGKCCATRSPSTRDAPRSPLPASPRPPIRCRVS